MDLGLGGRGYLLTGASRGLGFATARVLVDDGARVPVSSRSAAAVGAPRATLGGGGAACARPPAAVDAAVASLGGAPAASGVPADELGPRGIRVLGLLPGTIATDRITEIETASGDPDGMRARTEAGIPLRRVGRPEEFGTVAAFTLSPAASYLTGVMLPVDGGALQAL